MVSYMHDPGNNSFSAKPLAQPKLRKDFHSKTIVYKKYWN